MTKLLNNYTENEVFKLQTYPKPIKQLHSTVKLNNINEFTITRNCKEFLLFLLQISFCLPCCWKKEPRHLHLRPFLFILFWKLFTFTRFLFGIERFPWIFYTIACKNYFPSHKNDFNWLIPYKQELNTNVLIGLFQVANQNKPYKHCRVAKMRRIL